MHAYFRTGKLFCSACSSLSSFITLNCEQEVQIYTAFNWKQKKKDKWKSQHLNLHELFSICPSTPALHMSPPEQALGMVLEVLEPRIFGCHKHPASTRGWAIRSEGSGKWDICFVWISAPPRSFRPVIFWEHAIMTTSVILSYINILQYLK